jgi:DEAD/DEAH box helicase domain-containing protein
MAVVTWEGMLEGEELAYLTEVPGCEARTVPLPDLHPRLEAALRERGIQTLFAHQAEALAAARRGEHVVVATGTASGKTLAFNLPVLDALAADPKLRTLYLYPTKALAQDQARSLAEL